MIGAAIFAGTMLVILLLISRSIRELRRGADLFARGDLRNRLAVRGPLQLAALAESLNAMAGQLGDRLSTVIQQRNELGAVHDSMVEGVIAIDHEQNILSLNRAASAMLDLDPLSVIGRRVYEVVRNADLHDVIRRSIQEDTAVGGEMALELQDNDAAKRRHPSCGSPISFNCTTSAQCTLPGNHRPES